MKLFKLSILSFVVIGLTACGENEENTDSEVDSAGTTSGEVENVLEDQEESGWTLQTDNKFCEIMLPNEMSEQPELNKEATIRYSVTKRENDVVLENYIIVIPETHEEIEAYELEFEFTTESYSELCLDNMGNDMATYEVLSEGAEVEEINGMEVIINEMVGSMIIGEGQLIDIYYMIGVYKGEKAYYQVLSWTVADQKDQFKMNMEKMIRSFTEI